MDFDLLPYAEFCEWAGSSFLVVSANVFDPIIYYSHIIPVLISLPLATLVLTRAPKETLNRLFFLLVLCFSLWSFFDLILWAHADPKIIMFFWSLLILIEPIIYVIAFSFHQHAVYGRPLPLWLLCLLFLAVLPIFILLPSTLAIESFNLTNCNREVTEGYLVFYGYLLQVFVTLSIIISTIWAFFKREKEHRRTTVLFSLGILLFLAVFSSGNIVGSFSEDWTLGQYGIFGMPLMVAFIGYLIARYQFFRSKLIATEMLIGTVAIAVLGILFVQDLESIKTISSITFIFVLILGWLLTKSVRREIEQRKEIEGLAEKLKRANKRLRELDRQKSEFVSIASHQLRSPLTAIRGYASMLREGSFGAIPKKAQEAVDRIHESSRFMALSIEDFLNVSRIEQGRMKYELSDFNLKEMAEKVVDEMRSTAIQKGLVLMFRSECSSGAIVHADIGKVRQVLYNLVDNAMKYTPKGSIMVVAHDDVKKKKMYVTISDTGVGMSKETLAAIFEKFVRAKNANAVNVSGTGLGLFVAKQMIEAMGGSVTPQSEGEGKGSKFTVELPLAQ